MLQSPVSKFNTYLAVLKSEVFPPTSPKGRCVSFWYYVNDKAFGLMFNLKSSMISSKWEHNFVRMGEQWNYATFGFRSDQPYEITIQGRRASASINHTLLAVDDIFFRDSTFCATYPSSAVPSMPLFVRTTTLAPVNNNNTQLSGFACDFERDFCGWTQNTTITTGTSPERRQWRRYSGRAAFYSSQPKQDHT